LIAPRQPYALFALERTFSRRQHERVGDDVVEEIGARRAGVTEIVDLDRDRAGSENAGPAAASMPGEVDRDVDLEFAQAFADLAVARGVEIVEQVAPEHHPRPLGRILLG